MKMGSSRKRHIKYRSFGVLALLSAAAIMAAGCSVPGGAGPATTQLAPRAIKTEAIVKRTISSPIEQVADVAAGTTLDVIPKANGEVTQVLKKRGEYVEKGEVLFVINNEDALSGKRKSELSLRSAQEALQQARDNKVNNRKDLADAVTRAETAQRNAQQDYNKIRNDYDAGLATDRQVDQLKQALDSAQMNLESAQNKLSVFDKTDSVTSAQTQAESASLALEDATRSLENFEVKAPGSGILTDFNIVVGQTVSAAAGKVGQVQQVDPVKIKTELAETNYQLVKGKQQLVYYNPDAPDQKKTAPISYLAPIMSATTKTYTLELEVANPDHTIQPGTRYMVELTTETEEQVVSVPSLSIVREDADTYVFVQQGDQYQKRKVKLGRISGEYQEILDGVKEGDQLVVTGQNTLKDGQKVSGDPSPAPSQSATPAAK